MLISDYCKSCCVNLCMFYIDIECDIVILWYCDIMILCGNLCMFIYVDIVCVIVKLCVNLCMLYVDIAPNARLPGKLHL